MGILNRFGDIMKSNVNALLDKTEDPDKMIDQYLIDMKESLAEVKRETANIMALEKSSLRALEENTAETERYKKLAKQAVDAGKDGDAETFIRKYKGLEEARTTLRINADAATANADKMKQMHNKLVADIQELESRKSTVKSTVAIAKAVEKVNKVGNAADSASDIGGKFADMERKAQDRLSKAQAHSELNSETGDDASKLAKSYGAVPDVDVSDELAKLKGERTSD
jgi:phage shock protein A